MSTKDVPPTTDTEEEIKEAIREAEAREAEILKEHARFLVEYENSGATEEEKRVTLEELNTPQGKVEVARARYIPEYMRVKEEMGKFLSIRRKLGMGNSENDYKKLKNDQRALSITDNSVEKYERIKKEYDDARIEMAEEMYKERRKVLIDNGFSGEELEEACNKYRREEILQKTIIDERQTLINEKAEGKPLNLGALRRGWNKYQKQHWLTKIAVGTVVATPIVVGAGVLFGTAVAATVASKGVGKAILQVGGTRLSTALAAGIGANLGVEGLKKLAKARFERKQELKRGELRAAFGNGQKTQKEVEDGFIELERKEAARERNWMLTKLAAGFLVGMGTSVAMNHYVKPFDLEALKKFAPKAPQQTGATPKFVGDAPEIAVKPLEPIKLGFKNDLPEFKPKADVTEPPAPATPKTNTVVDHTAPQPKPSYEAPGQVDPETGDPSGAVDTMETPPDLGMIMRAPGSILPLENPIHLTDSTGHDLFVISNTDQLKYTIDHGQINGIKITPEQLDKFKTIYTERMWMKPETAVVATPAPHVAPSVQPENLHPNQNIPQQNLEHTPAPQAHETIINNEHFNTIDDVKARFGAHELITEKPSGHIHGGTYDSWHHANDQMFAHHNFNFNSPEEYAQGRTLQDIFGGTASVHHDNLPDTLEPTYYGTRPAWQEISHMPAKDLMQVKASDLADMEKHDFPKLQRLVNAGLVRPLGNHRFEFTYENHELERLQHIMKKVDPAHWRPYTHPNAESVEDYVKRAVTQMKINETEDGTMWVLKGGQLVIRQLAQGPQYQIGQGIPGQGYNPQLGQSGQYYNSGQRIAPAYNVYSTGGIAPIAPGYNVYNEGYDPHGYQPNRFTREVPMTYEEQFEGYGNMVRQGRRGLVRGLLQNIAVGRGY
jgi:hypothetical protein